MGKPPTIKTPEKSSGKLWNKDYSRGLVAFTIIFLSFGILFLMLVIQSNETSNAIEKIALIADQSNFAEKAKSINETFAQIEKSNQNVFNMMLPMLGAWVGAVVAFYFGSRNLEKAQEVITNLSKSNTDKTISQIMSDLITKSPKSLAILKFTLTDELAKIKSALSEFGNIVIIDGNGKPIGILYKSDFYKSQVDYPDEWKTAKTLQDFIVNNPDKLTDQITNKNWTKDGVVNFAILSLQDTIESAISKFKAINNTSLDVRGIVMSEEIMIAIVNQSIAYDH